MVLLPKGRLINLPSIPSHGDDKDIGYEGGDGEDKTEHQEEEEEEGDDGDESVESKIDNNPERALERAREAERNKKKFYPNYKRKKGLSKTRAWHMRRSAVRLEIVDDDEEIDIEETHSDEEDEEDSEGGSDGENHLEKEEQKIETEEVSLSGAFRSPAPGADSPGSHRTAIPGTSQEIECDIIVRTKPRVKSTSKKLRVWPRSVGQALKPAAQCKDLADYPSSADINQAGSGTAASTSDSTPQENVYAADPPFDDHNYAWHPTRYMSGFTFTNSRGEMIDGPEIEPESWRTDDLDQDPVSSNAYYSQPQPNASYSQPQPKREKASGSGGEKKSARRTVRRVILGGKGGAVKVEASSPRWVKVPSRDKREPTDEEKKLKVRDVELFLSRIHMYT